MSNFQRLTGHCRTCLNLYSQRLTVRRGDAGFNWLSGATLTHEAIYIGLQTSRLLPLRSLRLRGLSMFSQQ